ncbi:MAG: lipid-binding SYLF domain-containing protein [Spirochaetes bacterium]|nr:lipid-binding SYLF domain-containing protein [Spirochaetota bacterium]
MLMLILTTPYLTIAGYTEERKVDASAEVLDAIMTIPEQRIPPALLKNAYGVAVIPEVIKAGFVVGGRYGQGIVVVRTERGSWSDPLFITLAGASVGFQAGVQSSDVILVFKSKRSVDGIIQGKVTLGADAAVAAGPVGRQAAAATDIEFKAEIYSYSRSRGIFAGVSLDGAVLQVEREMTSLFYGVKNIDPGEVFKGGRYTAPAVSDRFRKVLLKYSE